MFIPGLAYSILLKNKNFSLNFYIAEHQNIP